MDIEITCRFPFADGAAWGDTGAYEMIIGRAHGAADPAAPCNAPITDLAAAPRNASGLVEYITDVAILRPIHPSKGNRRLFFDWGNRGNKRALGYFNDAPQSNDPHSAAHGGNGFLMRRGYTVVFAAWQADLLPGDGRMLLDVPALPIEGPVRTEFVGRDNVFVQPLSGWASTRSHPTVSLNPRDARLTRRRYATSPREDIPPDRWSFSRIEGGVGLDMQGADQAVITSDTSLHIHDGFRPGWIYELIYTGRAPLVLGLGHAAVRDLISFLRHDPTAANPIAGSIDKTYGWGRSQTGRAIRDYIYKGFNADTQGRRVFDGLLPHVAGAGRLNINRFANLTVPAGQQYEDHFEPADLFPFAYAETTDHNTGRTDAILKRPETDPLVIHTQTATEYWQRRGSLVHTDTKGNDLPDPANARIFHWAGSQHAADPNMKAPTRGICQNLTNVVATSALFRATLDLLDRWATDGIPPPPSRVPTRAANTLITSAEWRATFPAIPGHATPQSASLLTRLDYGPAADQGVLLKQPPSEIPGQDYAVLVPAVDADGNETSGIIPPIVAAPLATYTGWNLRARGYGTGAMHEFSGSTIPFPDTSEERAATGDPRLAIAERYPTQSAYTAAISAAARALIAAGLMLEEDLPRAEAQSHSWGAPRHHVRLP